VPACTAGAQARLPAALRGRAAAARDSAVAAALRSVDAALGDPLASADGSGIAFFSAGAGSTTSDLARPFAAFSASARTLGDSLVALARAQIGRKYRFGGTTPEHGFDCSGLVRYVLSIMHVPLPRTAKDQARTGAFVERDTSQLRPGDLVTFGSTRRISHIGIYVGGGRFVQASSKAGRVIETPLNRRLVPGVKPWRGARRVVEPDALPELAPSSVTTRDDDG
jgi:cell wall-associated NlpC family hydrolase